jgi:hypothetical protein
VKLRDIFKNHGATAMIEYDVYKTVLQRAGWALPRSSFVYTCIFQNNNNNKKKQSTLRKTEVLFQI